MHIYDEGNCVMYAECETLIHRITLVNISVLMTFYAYLLLFVLWYFKH